MATRSTSSSKRPGSRARGVAPSPAPLSAVDVVGVLGGLVRGAPDVVPPVVVEPVAAPISAPIDAPRDAPIRGTAAFAGQVEKLRELQRMRWKNTVALNLMEDADKEKLSLVKLKQQALDEEEKAIRNYLKLFHADDLRAMHGQVSVRIVIEELGPDGVARVVSRGELM